MEENLVGYLLEALDADEKSAIERYLREQPQGQRRMDLLRNALAPLALDRDMIEPPAGLSSRTLARVAQHQERRTPPRVLRGAGSSRTWWRRADVLVAACLLLTVTMLIPPGLSYLHYRRDISACQNNLREFFGAFRSYGDHHNGELPNVTTVKAPAKVAGLVVPVLMDQMRSQPEVIHPALNVSCPPRIEMLQSPTLQELQNMDPRDFDRYAAHMLGRYAYSLGYREGDAYRGHRLDPLHPNNSSMPIMGDRPPVKIEQGDLGNSPNHWGKGQNVLYSDGHCTFTTTRNSGVQGDDIYTNVQRKVAAGQHRWDAVLGESKARP